MCKGAFRKSDATLYLCKVAFGKSNAPLYLCNGAFRKSDIINSAFFIFNIKFKSTFLLNCLQFFISLDVSTYYYCYALGAIYYCLRLLISLDISLYFSLFLLIFPFIISLNVFTYYCWLLWYLPRYYPLLYIFL